MEGMARQRHPPLPSATRPFIWALRAFGVVIGLAGFYLAAVAAATGSWSIASAALIVGSAFAALTWMHPLSNWFAPTLVGLGIVVAITLQSWTTAAILAVLIGLVVWSRLRPFSMGGPRVDPDEIVIDEPGSVMKNARAFVDEFEAAGFTQVGALRFSVGPITVIASLLLSPDRLSYAGVTDSILNLTSRFSAGRGLLTRNIDRTPLPGYLLVDSVAGGSPTEMIESHVRALSLLAERGYQPISIVASELPKIALESERRVVAWATANRSEARSAKGRGPLWSRPQRDDQIEAWDAFDA